MKEKDELEYYEERKNWDFSRFEIESESLTDWNLYKILNEVSTKNSKILDLGTGGGEKVIELYPECEKILGTDLSPEMVKTANENLKKSGRKNIAFKVMDNLEMDVPENYFDIVIARNTVTDPAQIYKCLKNGGILLIQGVDMFDCYHLKLMFGRGQGFNGKKPISIVDYENILKAGFKDVEVVPIHEREYFKNKYLFIEFLKMVPIINDFGDEREIDERIIDKYIKENTYDGKIRLLRRYYGITARK